MIQIGDISITLPIENKLIGIYEKRPTYDFVYWNIIRAVLAENGIKDPSLIDVGANIGDTIAHFRRFSNGPAIGVEPHDEYFDLLEENLRPVANVTAIKALVCPPARVDDVSLAIGGGTGGTLIENGAGTYKDATISTASLLAMTTGPLVFKTDTDGFDQIILADLLLDMEKAKRTPEIISFEGPTDQQMRAGDYADYLTVIKSMCALGYQFLMLSNIGAPMAYPGSDYDKIAWQLNISTLNMSARLGLIPYYDFIAVAPDLACTTFAFKEGHDKTIWTDIYT